jgi:hypothetical protein
MVIMWFVMHQIGRLTQVIYKVSRPKNLLINLFVIHFISDICLRKGKKQIRKNQRTQTDGTKQTNKAENLTRKQQIKK